MRSTIKIMKRTCIIKIILYVILAIEITSIIFYDILFLDGINPKYSFSMEELKLKGNYNIIKELQKLFGEGTNENRKIINNWKAVIIFFTILSVGFLLTAIILQSCNDWYKLCRKIFSLIFLILAEIIIISLYVTPSIFEEYKVNLKDSEIYIFDDFLNQLIKDSLRYMYERKICILVFSLVTFIGIIVQFILIIIDKIEDNTYINTDNIYKNNNNKVSINNISNKINKDYIEGNIEQKQINSFHDNVNTESNLESNSNIKIENINNITNKES